MKITPEQIALTEKITPIFFPYYQTQRQRMIKTSGRFVHYTSAENALKIINTKCIWMRNATCMADYRELQHGYEALFRYFQANSAAFYSALNACSPGIGEEAVRLFDQWLQDIRLRTYITSISEHDNSEDLHGRLSMWRAFGGAPARVAIVIKLSLEFGDNTGLGVTISPVSYFTDQKIREELDLITANITSNRNFLSGVNRQMLLNTIFTMLVTSVVCLKHEGFHEEREWRAIYSPTRAPSARIPSSVEVIGGVPQIVCKIPFQNFPEDDISGMDPPEILDRIIIGPTQYPGAMYDAFVAALARIHIKDAANRVFISQIPVRT